MNYENEYHLNNLFVKCDYCGKEAEWVDNKEIYGRRYGDSWMMWWCKDCDAYVGCHNNSRVPLGRMANKELREIKKRVKNIWIKAMKEPMGIGQAYAKLAEMMGIDRKLCHFGYFGKEECLQAEKLINEAYPPNH